MTRTWIPVSRLVRRCYFRLFASDVAGETMIVLIGLIALVLSWTLTGVVRRYASVSMVDLPNARSSHSTPTPRGGGIAIVFSFALLTVAMALAGLIEPNTGIIVISGSLGVAIIGFLDDRKPVSARWRFLAHSLAAVWTLWLMSGISPMPLFGHRIDLGWFGIGLAALYLVWMTNLYNFMDGIDGIAGHPGGHGVGWRFTLPSGWVRRNNAMVAGSSFLRPAWPAF